MHYTLRCILHHCMYERSWYPALDRVWSRRREEIPWEECVGLRRWTTRNGTENVSCRGGGCYCNVLENVGDRGWWRRRNDVGGRRHQLRIAEAVFPVYIAVMGTGGRSGRSITWWWRSMSAVVVALVVVLLDSRLTDTPLLVSLKEKMKWRRRNGKWRWNVKCGYRQW